MTCCQTLLWLLWDIQGERQKKEKNGKKKEAVF